MVNFTAGVLASTIHRTPRLDLKLQLVGNEFDPTEIDYQEGIGSIIVLFLAVGLVVFGIQAYLVLCNHAVEGAPQNISKDKPRKRRRCLQIGAAFLFGVIVTLLAALYIFGDAVRTVELHFDNAACRYNDVTSSCDDIANTLNITADLTATIGTADGSDARTSQNALIQGCDNGNSQISALTNVHQNVAYNHNYVDSLTNNFGRYLLWGSLGMAALVGIPTLIMLIGTCFRSGITLQFSALIYVPILLLVIILAGVEYASSVILADFCVNPTNNTLRCIGDDESSLNFYITCDGSVPSPFDNYLGNASIEVNQSWIAWEVLSGYESGNETAVQILSEVGRNINQVSDSLGVIHNDLQCLDFHNDYTKAVKAICGNGLDMIFTCAVLHLIVAFFILFILSSLRDLWPVYKMNIPDGYTSINSSQHSALQCVNGSTHENTESWYEQEGTDLSTEEWYNLQVSDRESQPPDYGATATTAEIEVPWYTTEVNTDGGSDTRSAADPPPWYQPRGHDAGVEDKS